MAMYLVAAAASGLLIGSPAALQPHRACVNMGLHDITAKGMDGTDVDLKTLSGKKVIALNVASR